MILMMYSEMQVVEHCWLFQKYIYILENEY